MTILKAIDIKKSFFKGEEKIDVLQGIFLDVKEGETISIMGPSGVGKSTFLHILGGMLKPDHGEIILNERNIYNLKEEDLNIIRNIELGFVFQHHYLLPEFTALENIMLPALIKNSKKEAERLALRLIEEVGLIDRKDHFPNELSGGEQQRVAIARALINSPKVILADEPTGDLDEKTSIKVFELLQNIAKEKKLTLILATHNRSLAEKCEKTFYLHNGILTYFP